MVLLKSRSTLDLSEFSGMSNHLRKYVRAVERDLPPLQQALAESGRMDRVDWTRLPRGVTRQMRWVRRATPDHQQSLRWLGAFFAWHYLAMTHRRLRTFERGISVSGEPGEPNELRERQYRKLVERVGKGYRSLISGFTANLLEVFGGRGRVPELAFAVTGNLTDHEDLDVVVLGRDEKAASDGGPVISRMSTEFLRYASRLHFYLAEQLGDADLVAPPERYLRVLGQESRSFVAATQLIGARYLAGSRALFDQFDREVDKRYRFRGRGFVGYEGFVRGALAALGEILPRARGIEHLHPKREVSLPIKDVLYMAKARHGVGYRSLFELLDRLPSLDSEHADAYRDMLSALSFVEAFRYLYQLNVFQEEHVEVGSQVELERLRPVATLMGFESEAALVDRYLELRSSSHEAVERLADYFRQQLRRLSIFRRLARRPFKGNVAVGLLRFLTVYSTEIFWEDLFDTVRENPAITRRFMKDLEELPDSEQRVVVERLVERMMVDPRQALAGMCALGHVLGEERIDRFGVLASEQLRKPEVAAKFVDVFYDYPDLVDRFACAVSPVVLDAFRVEIEAIPGREFSKTSDKLLLLTLLRHYCSNYAARFFDRALPRFSEAVAFLDSSRELRRAVFAHLEEVEDIHSYEQRKERIGDLFALHFLRSAIDTFRGRDPESVALEYMGASDAIVNALYRVCRDQVAHRVRGFSDIKHDRDFALFAAGGNAREESFDADYDLIAVIDTNDPHRRDFFEKVMARFSVALARLGLMPHNRMADLTGKFVVGFDELVTILRSGSDTEFIEMSEVLGARMVIGTHEIDLKFTQRIVARHVSTRAREFVTAMREEIDDRFEDVRAHPQAPWNIKEDPGGLRDIHMFLQMLRAHYQIRQPVTRLAVDALAAGDYRIARAVRHVYQSLLFLMRVRDLYRLTVAAHDDLDPTRMDMVAGLMGYEKTVSLLEDLEAHCMRSNHHIEAVNELLELR